jgi:hypothetical protein
VTRLARVVDRARRRYRARPLDSLLALTAIVLTAWMLAMPFSVVHYPPITDLPMHAAVTGALRHWFDPSWHFRDQFELQPLRVPVLTQYVLGALFALFIPIGPAVKLAMIAMLSLLPIGLAVYCHGLKKSPLMGVAAAGFAWGPLTHWGFTGFLGAVGLTMAGVGVALRVVERPTRGRVVALGVTSALVFFTHVARFPFYCCAVAIAVAATLEARQRLRPVLVALAPSLGLFAAWWLVRPPSLAGAFEPGWHPERARRFVDDLSRSFMGSEELANLHRWIAILAGVGVYCLAVRVLLAVRAKRAVRIRATEVRRLLAAIGVAAMFAALYFWMPMDIGVWSVVYPREATAAALCSLAILPGLPRGPWLRAPALLALLLGASLPMRLVTRKYSAFERQTADFRRLVARLPRAPKLGYWVEDPGASEAIFRPLVHLPAWVQAERGGWLSFHFAQWDATPLRLRTDPAADVAPAAPPDFEWNPGWFDVAERGKYFDWFLVRSTASPAARFAVDPSLHLVRGEGAWWLYRRQ